MMTSKHQEIHEKLLDKQVATTQNKKHHVSHGDDKKAGNGTLLSRIEDIKTSKQFLEECTYFIELKDIYEVHSTCSYHESMPYSPILVKIKSPEIRQNTKANFLLQVWKKFGKKVYERTLQGAVSLWTISYDHFIYKPSPQDQDSDYLHIVDLKTDKLYLIKDFVQDKSFKYLTYSHGHIFIANKHQIKVGFVHLTEDNSDTKLEVEETLTITIDHKNPKIHGLFTTHEHHKHVHHDGHVTFDFKSKVLVALETKDQQIDFNFIDIIKQHSVNHDSGSHHDYELKQYREIIPRKKYNKVDPITSFQAVFVRKGHEDDIVAVTKRESGDFDLYYAGSRVYTSKKVKVRDIEITFDAIYLLMDKDNYEVKEPPKKLKYGEEPEVKYDLMTVAENETRIRVLDLKWENEINYENSQFKDHYSMENLFFQRIKKFCNLFSAFCLVRTVLIISHGSTISMYNILAQNWKHLFFTSEVKEIYRNHGEIGVTALFEDQTIRVIRQVKEKNKGEAEEPWEEIRDLQLKIDEKIVDTHQDREDNKFTIFITKREHGDKEYGFYALYEHKLYDITDQFEDEFHAKPNLVFLFSINEHTEFVLQHGHIIDIYTIDFEEDIPEGEEEKEEEIQEATGEKEEEHEEEDGSDGKKSRRSSVSSVAKVMKPKIRFVDTVDVQVRDEQGKNPQNLIKSKISDGVKFQVHDGHHHSVPKHILLLNDRIHFYKIDLRTKKIKTFENQNCIGMFFSDQNFLYSLCHKSPYKPSGLRLYDMENVVEKDQDYALLLTGEVQVGCQGHIDFSHENERIIFQSSFESIEVIPLVHRNTMSFIGMKERNNYIATKVMDGKFMALSNKGKLYTWDMITGKLIGDQTKIPSFKQYANFEIYTWTDPDEDDLTDTVYKKEWYSKILLKSKEPIKNFDESSYHGHGGSEDHIAKQKTYIQSIEKKFYEFRVVEIINESEVKTHLSFVHCVQPNSMQYLYFSEDLQYMYERLKFERHFLYERVNKGDGQVQWHQIHRFHKLPLDILKLTEYPFIFSPNFKRYLDLDDSHTKFIIRNPFNHEKVVAKIPDELMSAKDEPIEDVVRRFKWINENLIHIINHEGIERIIDINDDFKEVQFNFIPLYDAEICKKTHYLHDSPSYNLDECLRTLKKRYQYYKSAYNLKKNNNANYDLYQDIFCLDYRIENCNGQFEVDMSFSFLHWTLIEQLHAGKLGVEHLDHELIELMYYNILPHGNTVLHICHDNGELLEDLLKAAHPHAEDRSKIGIHIPFLKNLDGDSPIHLCKESEEYRYINVILEYLAGYDIDHHSRAIEGCLPVMIEHSLPNFVPYLESRIRQTEKAKKITKGMLKENNTNGICATSLWIGKHAIDELFQPAPIEQDVRLQYVDIPIIHSISSEDGTEFVKTLSESEDMTLFETTAVKKLIEFQWPVVLKYTIRKLLVPYIAFLVLFTLYIHGYWKEENIIMTPLAKYGCMLCLSACAAYLLMIELYQLRRNGLCYFFEVWNYLDIVPPVLITVFMILDITTFFELPESVTTKAVMQGTMSLFIWLKFLYFLRIFESTGYLIRIIVQVCIDMRHFLFLLLLTFIAFGEAIQSISDTTEEGFTGYLGGIGYVYRMVLGDFGVEDFELRAPVFMWILFLACTVLNMIIMMNLLIAIISESFANINSVSKQANYRERAKIISENLYLVPEFVKKGYSATNSYLLMAIDTEQELLEHQETMDSKIKTLKKSIKANNKKLFLKLKKRLNKHHDEITKALGVGHHLASRLGGSKYGGSLLNAPHGVHGNHSAHNQHH